MEELRAEAERNVRPCDVRIGACDHSPKNVRGMLANFQAFGIAGEVRVWQDDARLLKGVQAGEYRLIVTNPPYGLRIGNPRVVRELYRAFPLAAQDRGVEEIVLITPQRGWAQESLEAAGYRITETFRFLYGSLETFLLRAVIPSRGESTGKPATA
ncbi:MAG: hypothetical protein KatS3mg115_1391 [Candidatus Poribacteria bacterium]|nr:MAG: hypothetical protein KatS3mg115_1391 [Candidatus Poribacteria bacterium]